MAFPNLVLKPDARVGGTDSSTIWAEATGVPDNGANVIQLPFLGAGITPSLIDENWMQIWVFPQDGNVTNATFTSLAVDKASMTVNFTQLAAGVCRVVCRLIHTEIS